MKTTTPPSRKILVTSALLYANGSLHLGHIVEQIQTDIWVRFQKMRGHQCIYVGGDDAHGTPIMLSAQQRHTSPETLIKQIYQEHCADSADFLIAFDHYYTTHSPENRTLAEFIFSQLQHRGDITSATVRQAYDPVKNMFLPDRFVKGHCPRCDTADQYGDSCEACGATYSPIELKNPISALSGATPTEKESIHYFFQLPHYTEFLQQWTRGGHLQSQVANKLAEWFAEGLQPWDVSRDAPYFGFEIPGVENKYFYVWLDAPIGYMASFKHFCEQHPELDFSAFWDAGSQTELYHFIGKDIVYFHALFWPAMLHGAGFRTPTAIFAHGFLTIDGQKMSKSRGTFIKARTYLDHLDPEYLRYYFATKLTNGVDDLDLNFDDFIQRINSDLVGKVVNIASRCAAFINKHFDNFLSTECIEPSLFQAFVDAGDRIATHYENREFSRATRDIMELADRVNQYIDEQKPWALMKTPGQEKHVQAICSLGLNLFRVLMTYLKPILPKTAMNVEVFLQIPSMTWENRGDLLCQHRIATFQPLLQRVEKEKINAMKQATIEDLAAHQSHTMTQ